MATLQEVLAKHRSDLSGRCISHECTGTDWSNWPAHVVAMVEEAGLLVMTAQAQKDLRKLIEDTLSAPIYGEYRRLSVRDAARRLKELLP